MKFYLLPIALMFASVGAAQDLRKELELSAPIRPPLKKDAVEETLEARAVKIAGQLQHPIGKRDIELAKPMLRKRLAESLGYRRLPWPPDLRATMFGTVSRTGYHIEKIGYQTLPNVLVPAHVYVPNGVPAPFPALLFLIGGRSWKEGKASSEAQRFAIQMARLGFLVMVPDPMGGGERGPTDQNLAGLLVGLSQPGIIHYETQCALEYLLARKDVKGIGVTGVDGAGFETWITAALDDRISAAVPVDDTIDFAEEIHRERAIDWDGLRDERLLVPGILQYANVHELIALAAPRPLMIIANADAQPIYEFGQHLYASLDKGREIRMFANETVGYGRIRRQAAYGFFLWAMQGRGEGSAVEEPEIQTEAVDSREMACLPSGELAPSGSAIWKMVAEPAMPDVSLRDLAGAAPVLGNATLAINAFAVHRRNLASEQGIEVPVTILRPGPNQAGGNAGTLLVIDDNDKEALASDPIIQEALRRDYLVVEMDPRGFGELAVEHPNWVFATSLLLGENFVWRQAWDLQIRLTGFPFIREISTRAIYARGPKASLAASYAIWLTNSPDLAWAVLRDSYISVRQFTDSSAPIPNTFFAFGALRSTDIPEMLQSVSTHTFLIHPVNATPTSNARSDRVQITTVEQFLRSAW